MNYFTKLKINFFIDIFHRYYLFQFLELLFPRSFCDGLCFTVKNATYSVPDIRNKLINITGKFFVKPLEFTWS